MWTNRRRLDFSSSYPAEINPLHEAKRIRVARLARLNLFMPHSDQISVASAEKQEVTREEKIFPRIKRRGMLTSRVGELYHMENEWLRAEGSGEPFVSNEHL